MSRHELHDPGRGLALTLGALDVTAFSISGLATWIAVPSLDACFDLGHCTVEVSRLRNVLLSHAHQDHSLGVVRHLSLRAMTGARPSRVYLPEESREPMIAMLRAYERLEGKRDADLEACVRGVSPGDTFALSPRHRVHAFDVTHRLPSRGYTVLETRRKLLDKFVGLPGEALRDARAAGKELHSFHARAVLTHFADRTIDTIEQQT